MRWLNTMLVVILMFGAFFWVRYDSQKTAQTAIQEAARRLELTRDLRIAQLKSEIKTIYSEIRFWAESKPLREGFQTMLSAWQDLGSNPSKQARQLYIYQNPYYPNYTADFARAQDGSAYSDAHQTLHQLLKGLTRQRGYYDVFLIANNGDVVYSVYKEDDYGTNLFNGKYKDSPLASGFKEVLENTNLNHVALTDFAPYAPSNQAPASFVATSVIDETNKTQGVLAFQLPLKTINSIFNNTSGLGAGSEILVIGSDHLRRNQRLNQDSSTHDTPQTQYNSAAINQALKGETGVAQLTDYAGAETLSAYAPVQFSQNILGNTNPNQWAIVVKQDLKDVLKPAEDKSRKKWLMLSALAFLSLLLTLYIMREKEDLRTTEDEPEQ